MALCVDTMLVSVVSMGPDLRPVPINVIVLDEGS